MPLYGYALRRVADRESARDLTQEFFVRFLEKNYAAQADAARGRFRAFLLTSFKHFLANEWDRARAKKRGGEERVLSLDFDSGDSRLSLEPVDALTPDRVFERQWALTLLDHVLQELRRDYESNGKSAQFEVLKRFLVAEESPDDNAEPARQLGMTAGALRVAVHRLRKRYRELIRTHIAETVSDAEEIDEELRALFAALSRS